MGASSFIGHAERAVPALPERRTVILGRISTTHRKPQCVASILARPQRHNATRLPGRFLFRKDPQPLADAAFVRAVRPKPRQLERLGYVLVAAAAAVDRRSNADPTAVRGLTYC